MTPDFLYKLAYTGLMVVDVQNDFIDGTLPVPGAQEAIEACNAYISAFETLKRPVYYTMDFHPATTPHFDMWPVHCVDSTQGARLSDTLIQLPRATIFLKGLKQNDGYSPFESPSTAHQLITLDKLKSLFICGLAFDYCVGTTALDAKKAGLDVTILRDATASVAPDSAMHMEEQLMAAGVRVSCP